MNVLDKLEQFGERMYKKRWYRVLMFILILIGGSYVTLWTHEAIHFYYATFVLHTKAYIVYSTYGIRGYCVFEGDDFWSYASGGYITALLALGGWYFYASLPTRRTLPYDFTLLYIFLWQLLYGTVEVIGFYYKQMWFYNIFAHLCAPVSFVAISCLYYNRLKEYWRGCVYGV